MDNTAWVLEIMKQIQEMQLVNLDLRDSNFGRSMRRITIYLIKDTG